MKGKLMAIFNATRSIKDGMTVAIGGLTLIRKPMCMIHEFIREEKQNLTLMTFGGGPEIDLAVAAGIVNTVESSYVGFEIFGLAPNFRRALEANSGVKFIEHTEYSLIGGLTATTYGVPFTPTKAMLGSDTLTNLMKYYPVKIFNCPITDEKLVALPAIEPDVTIIYVPNCDVYGNAQISGVTSIDVLLAKASKKVILVTENIIPTEKLMEVPEKTQIPQNFVDIVVQSSFGAHPTSCFPYYTYDPWHLANYIKAARSEDDMQKYIEEFVIGVKSFEEYLDKVGSKSLLRIKKEIRNE